MNQRRLLAVVLLSAVIVAVLAVIVYTARTSATAMVSVWELTHDVTAGAPYRMDDVQAVQIHATSGDFSYESAGPDAIQARYAVNLSAHDIVTADDLLPSSGESEVAITVQDPPPVNPGDRIDVYAGFASGGEALIGRGVIVQSATGGSLVVLVPASDEPAWVAVSASSTALHVARIDGVSSAAPAPLSPDDAIRLLCGASCAGLSPATPSP